LVSFELSPERDEVFIHGTVADLRALAASIERLATSVERGAQDHVHLMTEAWGGSELSGELQTLAPGWTIISHVKIMGWTAGPSQA
jgi:hypothetical protein